MDKPESDPIDDAAVDALLEEFGDPRAAILALLHDIDVLARDFEASVSRGFVRRDKSIELRTISVHKVPPRLMMARNPNFGFEHRKREKAKAAEALRPRRENAPATGCVPTLSAGGNIDLRPDRPEAVRRLTQALGQR